MVERSRCTCLILDWQRPHNVRKMIDAFYLQTPRPQVWVWTNHIQRGNWPVDWHIKSSQNRHGFGLFPFMRALETEYFCYFDDDNLPTDPNLLSMLTERMQDVPQDSLIGAHGVNYGRSTYQQCVSLETELPAQDVQVDMVKFRAVFGRAPAVRSLPFPFETHHSDMHISHHLAGNRRRHHLVSSIFRGRIKNLPEGREAYSKQGNHYATRTRLMHQWLAKALPST